VTQGFKIKELMALELFREGVISTGKAAELLDIPKVAFIDILTRYNINYFSESPAELTHQISMVDALLKKETL
jgi:predicted HTH domain antitoxin